MAELTCDLQQRDRPGEGGSQGRAPVAEAIAELVEQRPEACPGVGVEDVEDIVDIDGDSDLPGWNHLVGGELAGRRRPAIDDVEVHVLERGVGPQLRTYVAVELSVLALDLDGDDGIAG